MCVQIVEAPLDRVVCPLYSWYKIAVVSIFTGKECFREDLIFMLLKAVTFLLTQDLNCSFILV